MRHVQASTAGLLLALATLLLSTSSGAQSIKLNAALPRDPLGTGTDAKWFELDPLGRRVLFTLGSSVEGSFELLQAPLDGGAPARHVSWLSSWGFRVDALSGRALYMSDQAGDGRIELWSVPLDGSAPPVAVSAPLVPGGGVTGFKALGDGRRVLFRADRRIDEVHEVWSASIDGSTPPVRLAIPGASPYILGYIRIAPGGERVAYLDETSRPGIREVWSAPLDGGPATRLHDPLPTFASCGPLELTPDGSRVVYRADALLDEAYELWSAPLDGSGPAVRISGPLGLNRDVNPVLWITPDSSRALYLADGERNEQLDLYSVPVQGGAAPLRLSGPMVVGGNVGQVRLTSSGARIVYLADAVVDETVELWSVPSDGSTPPLRLNTPGVEVTGFVIDDASAHVAFLQGDSGLWSVPLDRGTGPLCLDPTRWISIVWAGDGRVVYERPDVDSLSYELWSVPLDGSTPPLRLQSAHHLSGIDLDTPKLVAEGHVVYLADLEFDETWALWSTSIDGSTTPVRLSPTLVPDAIVGDVEDYAWTPDGKGVVYRANQEVDYLQNLFLGSAVEPRADPLRLSWDFWMPSWDPPWVFFPSADSRWVAWTNSRAAHAAPLDGSQPIRFFSGQGIGHADDLRFSPDGKRIVFAWRAQPPRTTNDVLYVAALDGGGQARSLSGPAGIVDRFEFAGGQRIVYLAHSGGAPRLRSCGLRPGMPTLQYHENLPAGRTIERGFQFDPEGRTIVFVADLERAGEFALYSAPVDGHAPRRRLDRGLVEGGDVDAAFRITRDGKTVVYVADARVDGLRELWSVPLDGTHAPQFLGGGRTVGCGVAPAAFVPDARGLPLPVADFEPTRDSARVVYRADQEHDEVFELFSVPLDGRTPPVRLHPALPVSADVAPLSIRLSPDGRRAVFAADSTTDERFEVFATEVDGSKSPALLSGPFTPGGSLWLDPLRGALESLQLTADGSYAVYLADPRQDEVFELFAATLQGELPLLVINDPLVEGGDVGARGLVLGGAAPFRVGPQGRSVCYLADQEDDDVVELFVRHLPPPVRPADTPRGLR